MKRKRLSRSRRGRGGYSFAESMIALMIVLLVTNSMVAGVQFAIREYHKSMILSESRVLCSTLTDIITDELSNTGTVDNTSSPVRYFSHNYAQRDDLVSFWSVGSGEDSAMNQQTFGEIAVGYRNASGTITGKRLLSSAAYSSYGLTAKVDIACPDLDAGLFQVTLTVRTPSGDDVVTSFDVLCLNDLHAPET